MTNDGLLAGVIEGFYGQPWSQAERMELYRLMAAWGLNTYMYAPKDDLKHRALWREPYTASESAQLQELVTAAKQSGIQFIYALSPGLDIQYGSNRDLDCLKQRFAQIQDLGCRHFCLLFDDIPDRMHEDDLRRWSSLASAQCYVANTMFDWLKHETPFLFCPTPYCGRMAMRNHGGEGYLSIVGRELSSGIDVFWTGPEIISREITVTNIQEISDLLRRKPLIWDNLHANDYDGRRFYCGPYSGRPLELRTKVRGFLCNPNNEFPLNFVLLRTMADYIRSTGSWEPRQAYLAAMKEWWPYFKTLSNSITLEDLILFGDCFYLPYEEGCEAEALFKTLKTLLSTNPVNWGDQAIGFCQKANQLLHSCVRMAELCNRPLFYALSRRVWELREEMDLLEKYVRFRSQHPNEPFTSDFHLPKTYRGGMVARLQRLFSQNEDGTFAPSDIS